ncbi:MAG TPA: twin-arginine translocase subunit TatC [Patescibacteria group bacterium]|jgi:sec-independent protein translocase protein TatC|nr:twin-arginine translocase subunit TatC [Patescibacteria group bacterium]
MVVEPEAEQVDSELEEGGPVKSFLEHLEDLRWVLIKSAAALAVAILVCLIAGNHVVDILRRPLKKAHLSFPGTNQVVTVYFGTNQFGPFTLPPAEKERFNLSSNRFVAVRLELTTSGTNQVITWRVDQDPALAETAQRLNIELLTLSPASGFFVAFQVAFYAGIVIASPFIFYFVAAFVFPALKLTERYYVYRGLGFGVGLFLLGVVFCYFALMPLALAASQRYSQWLGFSATQWKADDYISFICKFMLGMGLGFEMPVVILTLVKIGVVDYSMLSKARKYMIVINLVLGAVLTTPEVITQLIMFLPLQLLFEISLWIAWYWERRDRKREAEESQGASG